MKSDDSKVRYIRYISSSFAHVICVFGVSVLARDWTLPISWVDLLIGSRNGLVSARIKRADLSLSPNGCMHMSAEMCGDYPIRVSRSVRDPILLLGADILLACALRMHLNSRARAPCWPKSCYRCAAAIHKTSLPISKVRKQASRQVVGWKALTLGSILPVMHQ